MKDEGPQENVYARHVGKHKPKKLTNRVLPTSTSNENSLVPQYKAAAKNLNGIAKMAAIDCDDDKNKPLCGQYGIKGTARAMPWSFCPLSSIYLNAIFIFA